MKYLLDTCVFLYYLEGNRKLSKKAIDIIMSDSSIYLSQASLWEIAIKKTINKLEIKDSTYELIKKCDESGIILSPIRNKYFDTIQRLPLIHGDPFDRLIIATAVEEKLHVVTDDGQFKKYAGLEVEY